MNVIELKRSKDKTEPSPIEEITPVATPEPKTISEISLPDLTPAAFEYFKDYQRAVEFYSLDVPNPVEVDRIASGLARFYEKLRQLIDWKEEHLMRRASIERILKRKYISKVGGRKSVFSLNINVSDQAESFVEEVIRTGHFSNRKVSKSKIPEVQRVLNKYEVILRNNEITNDSGVLDIKTRVEFYNWLMELAACEVEETLDPSLRENALIDFMTKVLVDKIVVIPKDGITDEDKYIQTYLAVHRALFNLESSIVSYHLIKHLYPFFTENSEANVNYFGDNIGKVWKEVEKHLNYESSGDFFGIAEKYDAAFLTLGDAMNKVVEDRENLENVISSKGKLAIFIEDVYKQRLSTLKRRLNRSAIYSTLSILVAGLASLAVLEFPLAKWLYGEFKPWAMFVDLMVPTVLMFGLVSLIRPPKKSNYEVLLQEVYKTVFANEVVDEYEVYLEKSRSKIGTVVFTLVYLVGGLGSLYLVYKIFDLANVPWTSLYVDVANVAIVVFAAMLIRHKSREITIEEDGGLVEFLLNFFSVPLAKIGMWLSAKWKEYNFVSVFMTVLVDMPFSTLVSLISDWRKFINEKRAQIH